PPPPAAPPRPIPPSGASANVPVPPLGPDGLRISVNRAISPAQTIWNLRAAFNVAALDCSPTNFADIAPAYRDFLTNFKKQLAATNRKVDAEYRTQYGTGYIAKREAYMTQVYNHDALPPTLDEFCKAIEAVSRDAVTVKPVELEPFAQRSLPSIEIVFDEFYRHYSQYQADLAAWEARWGVPPVPATVTVTPQPAAPGTN
ncbi:MAG: hypothetical protein M3N34_08855, partial [Pseudomonadota bacterium]|nr:hypothetical protein [Pseudomonadota bacterium]